MTKQVLKNNQSKKWKIAIRSLLAAMILSLVFTSISFAEGGGRYEVDAWSFGVHGDTQWTLSEDPTGKNPNYVSAAIAGALNKQFINTGVKFVIQVGDLTDRAGDAAMYTRAEVAQTLYNKGIGFFPLRGNHEEYGNLYSLDPDHNLNIPAYLDAFPQTQGTANTFGTTNFSSPSDIMTGVDILDGLSYSFDYGAQGNNARFVIVDVEQTSAVNKMPPQFQGAAPYDYIFFVVYRLDYPIDGITTIYDSAANAVEVDKAITIPAGTWFRIDSHGKPSTNFYAWDMANPDQTTGTDYNWPIDDLATPSQEKWDSSKTEFWPGMQQGWISERLDKTARGTEHAFVFSHRGIMGGDHVDCFFGEDPSVTPEDQNAFYASLANNDVKYMISGHDHFYNRAQVASPDGLSHVEQLISIGASTKFYGPASLNSFPGGVKNREAQISQEADNNIGYYIYTVDGPRVTVDYYSDSVGNFGDGEYYPDGNPNAESPVLGSLSLPDFDFVRKETWGYSQNGQQFLIAQGESYKIVKDRFYGTTAKILDGTNNSTATDATPTVIDDNGTPDDPGDDIVLSAPRPLSKTVNTGWVARSEADKSCCYNHHWKKKCKKHHNCKSCKNIKSNILSLWGMSELGANGKTDTYVLSMSFDFNRMVHLGNGGIGIATFVDGEWVNAVDENYGNGKRKFVVGKYKPQYGLGTYGIDPKTKTAWAVLDYNADFAVVDDIKPVPGHRR